MPRRTLLTTEQAARRANLSARHFRRLRAAGHGPPVHTVTITVDRFDPRELDQWIADRKQPRKDT